MTQSPPPRPPSEWRTDTTTSPQTIGTREQQIDVLATRIMDMVETASPIGGTDGGTIGTEALLSALLRRTGPCSLGYWLNACGTELAGTRS